MVWISVALVDGLIRSSRASDWYNFADAVPGFVNIAIMIFFVIYTQKYYLSNTPVQTENKDGS